ncbi:MAG: DNA-binding response regulator [Thiotrichales bacterium]|nr:MAG: DNA-binding response regulator [Thiotrichales bacterium]
MVEKKQILLIEDEAAIRQMIRVALEKHGYKVIEAGDVAQARVAIADSRPDLLLVDWMLPDQPGTDLITQLRAEEHTRTLPVIMLTARAEENDMIKGLDSGADDYLYKPVSLKNLHARIKALLRRAESHSGGNSTRPILKSGEIELNTHSHQLNISGHNVPLSITEFRLLAFLMAHAGRAYSRTQLLDAVWGQNSFIEERTVDVHILRLRKVLKKRSADKAIKTIRGAGYLFDNEVSQIE